MASDKRFTHPIRHFNTVGFRWFCIVTFYRLAAKDTHVIMMYKISVTKACNLSVVLDRKRIRHTSSNLQLLLFFLPLIIN